MNFTNLKEKSFLDAPIEYSSEEAFAWANGYNNALAEKNDETIKVLKESLITIKLYTENKIGDGSQNARLMEAIQNLIKINE